MRASVILFLSLFLFCCGTSSSDLQNPDVEGDDVVEVRVPFADSTYKKWEKTLYFVLIGSEPIYTNVGPREFWTRVDSANNSVSDGLEKINNPIEALPYFTTAIELSPGHKSAFYYRGLCKQRLGDFRGSILDFNMVDEIERKENEEYNPRGNKYFKSQVRVQVARAYSTKMLGDLKRAESDLNDFLKGDEVRMQDTTLIFTRFYDNPWFESMTYSIRALIRFEQRDYQNAIEDCNKSIALERNFFSYLIMGKTKILLGRRKDGCLDLSKAGELGADDAFAMIRQECN